ncbi:MAG: tRNA pseudouridine(13) synthase TruD, partial [Candidatus Poseidoniaceae archaeon]
MQPNDSLAEAIGLIGYATEDSGIGGVLKSRVVDFRVDEIATSIALNPKGRFTVANITLTNWETNRFCNNLAKKLSISRNRIFFAGTKDKRAVTSQIFVIDAPQFKVAEIEMNDVIIEVLGRTHQKIGFGNHRGNRFTIVVRGCAHQDGTPMSEDEALSEVERIKENMERKLGIGRFPNWIGPQRFGSGRAVTAEVGRSVVQHRWDEAAHTYISKAGEYESPEVAAFREHIRENGITQEGLDLAPDWLGYERRMTEHLLNNPGDFIGAFRKLPNNLQIMTVHALQSVVFNRTLRKRLEQGISITIPEAGDLVGRLDERGQLSANNCVLVEERTAPRIGRNCQLGRLSVTGPLPGRDIRTCEGKPGQLEESILSEMGLAELTWEIEDIPRLTTTGTRRSLTTSFEEFTVEAAPKASSDTLG